MPLEPLTPNTVLLVLLLNELNEQNESDFNPNLNKFVIDRILVSVFRYISPLNIFRTKLFGAVIMTSLQTLTKKQGTLFF